MTLDTRAPARGRPVLGALAGLLVVALPPAFLVLGGVIGALHPLGFLGRD